MDKRTSPRSDLTKRKISETLSGTKRQAEEFKIIPKDGEQLRAAVTKSEDDSFKYQLIVDWYRDLKGE